MPRRKDPKKPGRKLNGKKRPRAWHHGSGAGRQQLAKLEAVSPAFDAAAADVEAVQARTRAHRVSQADWESLLVQLERVAPSPLAGFPALLG